MHQCKQSLGTFLKLFCLYFDLIHHKIFISFCFLLSKINGKSLSSNLTIREEAINDTGWKEGGILDYMMNNVEL